MGVVVVVWQLLMIFCGDVIFDIIQIDLEGFFMFGQEGDYWWLLILEGKLFFLMGLNYIDLVSLCYLENIDIWWEKYGGSMICWIEELVVFNL